jgi:biopolymer transport protein ExbD
MASLFHRSKQRRAEWAPVTAHGNINLVPLVDILTSIVFFSLLTYEGATLAALTSFDLALPPVVVSTPDQASRFKADKDVLNLLLAVRVDNDKMVVEHSAEGGFRRQIDGLDTASLDQLQSLMADIRKKYPQNSDVLVIPSDDVNYDNIIHVLERLRMAKYGGISLGSRARGAVAAAGAGR